MRNQDHLFVETPELNLSAGMQYLNSSDTSYFNRRHRRAGTCSRDGSQGHLIEDQDEFPEVDAPEATPVARRDRESGCRALKVATVPFSQDTSRWQAGRHVDDASRAVATYLARRHYGYSAKAVAAAFGYRGPSRVHTALLRIEDGTTQLRKTVNHLAKALDKRLTAL